MTGIRWTRGDAALQRAIEAQLAAGAAEVLHENPRRVVRRVRTGAGDVALKQFRVGSGHHPIRERAKAWLGRAPADREWRALVAMRRAQVRAPAPLALGTLPDGDRLLALAWVEGVPLASALRAPAGTRRALLDALAALLRRVHASGWVHGDPHADNVRVDAGGPVLLDWQRAHRCRHGRPRLRDLARLEQALAPWVSAGRRLRLRAAVLGLDPPFRGAARARLRAAGRAFTARVRALGRSRTRHLCRPGRLVARVHSGRLQGLRLHSLSDATLEAILANHAATRGAGDARVLETGPRAHVTACRTQAGAVIVKETPPRGLARALADVVRGSAGARAWRGGHGLRERGVGAALPLAYLERRRAGIPLASWVVLEDLRPAVPAAFALDDPTARPEPIADALLRLLVALHGCGADHGDLKATHVLLTRHGARLEPKLIDLEGVAFRRRLSDARRVRALAELNASLPDAYVAAWRRQFFLRYATALPFEGPRRVALERVVRASLARRHRWTGAGCALAAELSPAPAPATGSSSTSR